MAAAAVEAVDSAAGAAVAVEAVASGEVVGVVASEEDGGDTEHFIQCSQFIFNVLILHCL